MWSITSWCEEYGFIVLGAVTSVTCCQGTGSPIVCLVLKWHGSPFPNAQSVSKANRAHWSKRSCPPPAREPGDCKKRLALDCNTRMAVALYRTAHFSGKPSRTGAVVWGSFGRPIVCWRTDGRGAAQGVADSAPGGPGRERDCELEPGLGVEKHSSEWPEDRRPLPSHCTGFVSTRGFV